MFTGRKYFMSDKSNLNQKQDSQAQIINAKAVQNIFQKKSREKVNANFLYLFLCACLDKISELLIFLNSEGQRDHFFNPSNI